MFFLHLNNDYRMNGMTYYTMIYFPTMRFFFFTTVKQIENWESGTKEISKEI